MKHFSLFTTIALALSTYFQANASLSQTPLSRLGLEGIYVIVDKDYLNNEATEYSLRIQIANTLKSNNISNQNPLYLIIGKGIADNQDAFDKLIVYLNRTRLKSIIISLEDNVKNDITHLKNDFLANCELTSFASNGFQNVTSIKNNFLRNNEITFFSAEDFKNLKQIGDSFLASNQLTSFSTQGLEKVTTIGAGFLAMNNPLKSVDLRALESVVHIEDNFLAFCPHIQEIIVSEDQKKFFREHIPYEHKYKVVVK